MAKAQTTKTNKNKTEIKVSSNSKTIAKAQKLSKPAKEHKWERKQVKDGDYFSCHQYMKVVKISGDTIKLQNDRGESLEISKEVLICDSFSADHYEKEVRCTMTELSEIL
jgi:hypothetical protein